MERKANEQLWFQASFKFYITHIPKAIILSIATNTKMVSILRYIYEIHVISLRIFWFFSYKNTSHLRYPPLWNEPYGVHTEAIQKHTIHMFQQDTLPSCSAMADFLEITMPISDFSWSWSVHYCVAQGHLSSVPPWSQVDYVRCSKGIQYLSSFSTVFWNTGHQVYVNSWTDCNLELFSFNDFYLVWQITTQSM